MTFDRFHRFTELPPELRWQIWEEAICINILPRLHYYSLFHKGSKENYQSLLQPAIIDPTSSTTSGDLLRKSYEVDGTCNLVQHWDPETFAWAKANRYRNLWDSGLRTACPESSRAILPTHKEIIKKERRLPVVASTDDEDVEILIDSRLDLVCFEFSPEDLKAAVDLEWRVLISRLPMYQQLPISQVNLAFEYEESWSNGLIEVDKDLLRETSTRGLMIRAFWAWVHNKLPSDTTIWLIDREWRPPATRASSSIRCQIEPARFFDGEKEYVEIWKRHLDMRREGGAVGFISILNEWHEDYLGSHWVLPYTGVCLRALVHRSSAAERGFEDWGRWDVEEANLENAISFESGQGGMLSS